jgi:hypothetical protein
MTRRKLIKVSLLLVIAAGAIGYGVFLWERFSLRTEAMLQMPCLAGATYFYHREHRDLPDTLAAMEATGLYAPTAYRLPGSEWELMFSKNRTGASPFYAPVHGWDGSTRFIIAVGPKIDRSRGRGRQYVLLGDTKAYFAPEEELARLLAEDDARRATAGQVARWSEIGWAWD